MARSLVKSFATYGVPYHGGGYEKCVCGGGGGGWGPRDTTDTMGADTKSVCVWGGGGGGGWGPRDTTDTMERRMLHNFSPGSGPCS